MAIGSVRNPEVTARALARWLEGVLDGASEVAVSNVSTPGATGYSNETILFHAAWRDNLGNHDRDLVARVEPTTAGVFPTYDVGLQYDVLRAVAAH
jgi:aminoglycoside phosphotransferase (APT) family kinase protein